MADLTPEEIQAKIESLEKTLADREAKITELSSSLDEDKKEMIRKREEAKEAERKALEEQSKFQELYLKMKKEHEEYKSQYAPDKFETLEKQINNMIKAQKEKLLSAIPEEDRELFIDLDVEKLEKLVAKLGSPTVGVDHGTGRTQPASGSKKWADMSDKERIDISNSDPKKAKELMREFFASKKK